jgi:DNA processing protein
MAEHGHAEAALAALPEIARDAGVADYAPCPEPVATAEMKAASRIGATLLCLGDAAYPEALARIPDPPPVLWALGDVTLAARPCLAVVGTRNASALGARMARRLTRDLGEAGFVIVSGLARGIDALAHEARWRPEPSRCTRADWMCSIPPRTPIWPDGSARPG